MRLRTTLLPHLPRGHPVHSPFVDLGQTFVYHLCATRTLTPHSHFHPHPSLSPLTLTFHSHLSLSPLTSHFSGLFTSNLPTFVPSSVRSPPSVLSFFVHPLRTTRTPSHFRNLKFQSSALKSLFPSPHQCPTLHGITIIMLIL